MILFRRLVFIAAVFAVFSSCGKIGEEIFGDWWPYDREGATKTAKGSGWEILQERGDCNLFLAALEKTNYKNLVNGAGLVTVFAPTDDAFTEYLLNSEWQTTDLNAIPLEELTMLVGYHLIQFAYSADDFLAFSTSATSENPVTGDGTAFKYKTYARKPIVQTKDPVNERPVRIFHREEYLPILSTKLFKTKESPDIEADYKTLFEDVNWIDDSEDRFYVGNAKVLEAGIPADNGYLYVIDKVANPLPTIYEALSDAKYADFNSEYSYIAKIFQSLSLYKYDVGISNQYADPGDSLYYHYSFMEPTAVPELPEIGSEWAYHNDLGVDVQKSMSWSVTAVIPTNDVLEEWMREYFADWFDGDKTMDNVIGELPYVHLYQIAVAHLFDKRQIIIPSELYSKGVAGAYGEQFEVDPSSVEDIKVCSNGIIYGTNKVNKPVIFDSFVAPLFQTDANRASSTYSVYTIAFMARDMYKLAAERESAYTLFVINDENIQKNRLTQNTFGFYDAWNDTRQYRYDPLRGDNFVPAIYDPNAMSDASKGNFVNRALVYGRVPDPEAAYAPWYAQGKDYLRYYKTQQEDVKNGTYIFSYNGNLYDQQTYQIDVHRVYEESNGNMFEVGQLFRPGDKGGINVAMGKLTPGFTDNNGTEIGWRQTILWNADLNSGADNTTTGGNKTGGLLASFNTNKDYIMFALSDKAVEQGLRDGRIPRFDKLDPEIDPEEMIRLKKKMRDYALYHMIDIVSANLPGYILPGYGLNGATDERFEISVRTLVEYTNVQDAKYLTIIWDPEDPSVLTLRDYSGKEIKTRRTQPTGLGEGGASEDVLFFPDMRPDNGMMYVIDDDIFDVNTMFGQ